MAPRGRPSKYDPSYPKIAANLCRTFGAIDEQLADFFGVNVDSIYEWKKNYPEFSEAIASAKEFSNFEIEKSLYHRAKGYSHPAVKIMQFEGQPIKVPYTEHYPPDVKACELWLTNRDSKRWKAKQEVDLGDNLTTAILELASGKGKQG